MITWNHCTIFVFLFLSLTCLDCKNIFKPSLPTISGKKLMFSGRTSGCPAAVNTYHQISIHLVAGFQRNLAEVINTWVTTAEKGFQDQRSKVKVTAIPNTLLRQRLTFHAVYLCFRISLLFIFRMYVFFLRCYHYLVNKEVNIYYLVKLKKPCFF